MPNYITNKIVMKAKKKSTLSRFFKKIIDKDNAIDFGLMLPQEDWGTKWNAGETKFSSPDFDCIFDNEALDRYSNVKVNVSYLSLNLTEIQKHLRMKKGFYYILVEFETAWSYPEPVINEMSKRFPNIFFDIEWADEDIGMNCGSYNLHNLKETNVIVAPNYKTQEKNKERYKWVKKACDIKGIDPIYYGYDSNGIFSEAIQDDPEKFLRLKEKIKEF